MGTSPTIEFERIGPSRRKVTVGDVFAARLNDGRGFLHGQVLHDDVRMAGAVLLLIAFFRGRSDLPAISCEQLLSAELRTHPFVTNRTGWFDGRFLTLQNCPPLHFGRVGLRRVTGQGVYDLGGNLCDVEDFDLLGRYLLSPPGAIALSLSDGDD